MTADISLELLTTEGVGESTAGASLCTSCAAAGPRRVEQGLPRFRDFVEYTNDFIYVFDAESGQVVDANDAMPRRLGYSREELLGMRIPEFSVNLHEEERSWVERVNLLRRLGAVVTEGLHRCKSGEVIPVEVSLRYLQRDGKAYAVAVTRDITERKYHEQQIERLVRMTRMQSGISSAVLRIRERDELLQEACRIATEVGGYDRTVLSLVEGNGKIARPAYRAGKGGDFPEPALLEIADGPDADTSVSGRALRTGQITFCDLAQRTTPAAMREPLLAIGYKSLIALPLIIEGRRVGVLTLASREMNILRDDELTLLQDITATLAFALRSQQHADAAEFLTYYDSMTGLARRQLFCERLGRLLREPLFPTARPAVAVFDIRGLSHINDSLGRHFGDRLLQMVAERLRRRAGSDDRIAYLGSGTFAMVELQFDPGYGAITSVLDSCVFNEPFTVEERTLSLEHRSGIAYFPADGTQSGVLLDRAEAALRLAKEAGERYMHYRLDLHSEVAERLELEHRLRAAVDRQQFELYYQPQVDVQTGRIEFVEALLRWNDPVHGVLSPARFLTVLESSGLITTVGTWALRQAARDLERWSAMGLPALRVAVNVSPLQLVQRDFVEQAIALRRGLDVQGGFGLDLEITETGLLQDLEGAGAKLRQLRDAEFRIALDDFGTGYSSLGLLSKLPVDILKIDRSFVSGLPEDAASARLTESIIRLACGFGLITVAEGVERAGQLQILRRLRCDYWQGYLYSAPVRAPEIDRMLARSGRRRRSLESG